MMATLAALGDLGCCIAPFLVFAAVIGGSVFFLINSSVPGGLARGKEMQAAAAQLGWSYVGKLSYQSIPGAASLHLFSHGAKHRVVNLLTGLRDGVEMRIFDHQFRRAQFSQIIFTHTVAMAPANGIPLPAFVLRTRDFFGKLGVYPPHPITCSSHPKFCAEFLLAGADEAAVSRIFTEAVLEYCEIRQGLCLESAGGFLYVFRQGILAPPHMLGTYLDEANTLLRMFASSLAGVPMAPPPLPPPLDPRT